MADSTSHASSVPAVYVGNLPLSVSESQVRALFESFGSITRISVPLDKDTAKPRGFAFVHMPNQDEADQAIRSLEDTGRQLKVNFAQNPPRSERPLRGGGRDRDRDRAPIVRDSRESYPEARYDNRPPRYESQVPHHSQTSSRAPDPRYDSRDVRPAYDTRPPSGYDSRSPAYDSRATSYESRPPAYGYDAPPRADAPRYPPRETAPRYDAPAPRYDASFERYPPPRDRAPPPAEPRLYDSRGGYERPPSYDPRERAPPPSDYDRRPPAREYDARDAPRYDSRAPSYPYDARAPPSEYPRERVDDRSYRAAAPPPPAYSGSSYDRRTPMEVYDDRRRY